MEKRKITVPMLQEMKAKGTPIACLTSYDSTLAAVVDSAGMDLILVGDSAGMVVRGDADTLSVTVDEMVFLTRSVRRGVKRALLVADMPFGPLQESAEACVAAAVRFMKEARAEAVKVEGGSRHTTEAVERMTALAIPVMGHLGLTPQSVNSFGGYGLRGADDAEAERIKRDARALQDAGAFAIVLEKIPAELAAEVTASLTIPTIGIGSGPSCDGQILVLHDMLGLGPKFRFVRRYMDGTGLIKQAVGSYVNDIRDRSFPNADESYRA